MANFRQIHVSIWKDPWFLELEPDEKLLFIYLFSNESTSLAGIYQISIRVIGFETGLSIDFIKKTLDKFQQQGKVQFDNGIMWVKNLRKYNTSTSDKVQTRIRNDIASIPECPIKAQYIAHYQPKISYPEHTDTLSTEQEEEEEMKGTPEEMKAAATSAVFNHYQNNIGTITKTASEKLGAMIDDYPADWIIEAIDISVENNKRSLAYFNAILQRWDKDGKDNGKGKNKQKVNEEVERSKRATVDYY